MPDKVSKLGKLGRKVVVNVGRFNTSWRRSEPWLLKPCSSRVAFNLTISELHGPSFIVAYRQALVVVFSSPPPVCSTTKLLCHSRRRFIHRGSKSTSTSPESNLTGAGLAVVLQIR
ncbi:Uncharacterized protein Rs2_29815 [Raphanus sativus]|nr:Uncharacterized protein Rs2_29815 [Raphanus sativus]